MFRADFPVVKRFLRLSDTADLGHRGGPETEGLSDVKTSGGPARSQTAAAEIEPTPR